MKTYPASKVAEATGASLLTLQRYVKDITPFQPCDGHTQGSGDKRKWSLRRVIQTAITVECSRLGIAPSRGGKAALEFSDRGNVGRAVGALYPLGATYLVGLPDGENRVLNVPPDLSISDMLADETAAFIINCNNVVADVTKKLDTK